MTKRNGLESIRGRAKALRMIYETPELREFVAYLLITEKQQELKLFTNVAHYLKDEYCCIDSAADICNQLRSVAYKDFKPSQYGSLMKEIVCSEPNAVYSSAMSHLYFFFSKLDWNGFTSDASEPLHDVELILNATRREFEHWAKKEDDTENDIDVDRLDNDDMVRDVKETEREERKTEGLMPRFNGKKYRELMDQQGLTERKVAEHIGYTPPLVHYIIAGTRSPNFEQVVGMADLVGCSVDELIIRDAV